MKVPENVLSEFFKAAEGVDFGRITLEIVLHDGRPRFRIVKEMSYIPGKKGSSGSSEVLNEI